MSQCVSVGQGEFASAAVKEEAAVEAADTVEGVDQQAAAASAPETREASLQLPAGVTGKRDPEEELLTLKREPEEEMPGKTAKRIKQEP